VQTGSAGVLRWATIGLAVLVGVLILVAFLVSGPGDRNLIAVPTAAPITPAADGSFACHSAAFGGELASHPVWGIAVRGLDGRISPMIWPHGYVGRISGDELQLLDANGQVIGRTGDWIKGAGGAARLGNIDGFLVCPPGIQVSRERP
jgi:hypothetical protein